MRKDPLLNVQTLIAFVFFLIIFPLSSICFAASISGTVTDDSQSPNPLVGVVVQAYSEICHNEFINEAVTDVDGNYTITDIPEGTQVYVWADSSPVGLYYTREWYDYGSGTADCGVAQAIDAGSTGINFVLEAAGSVTGTITDADDQPIANMHVNALAYDPENCNGRWLEGADTNAQGVYRIDHIPAGDIVVNTCSECTSLNYVNEFFDDTRDCSNASPISVTAGATVGDYDFQLEPGGTLTGTILDTAENPVTGVSLQVVVYGGDPCGEIIHITDAWSDSENGSFTINGIPEGTYYLRAWAGDTHYIGEWWANSGSTVDCQGAETFSIDSGDTLPGYTFQLEEGGILTGSVKDSSTGSAITGVSVQIDVIAGSPCGENTSINSVWTDPSNGTFTISEIPAGDYYLRTSPGESNYISEWWIGSTSSQDCEAATTVTVTAGNTIDEFEFQLEEGGQITGYVYQGETTSTGIAGAYVYLYTDLCHNGFQYGVQTDGNGYFEFQGLPANGSYVLRAQDDGQNYVSQWYDNVTDIDDCNTATFVNVGEAVTFNLMQGAIISGQVNDMSGAPIENVHVYATDADTDNWIGGVDTQADGTFYMPGLPAVDCRVHICPTCNGLAYVDEIYNDTYYHHAAAIVTLSAGDEVLLEEIRLAAGNTISGTISGLDPDQFVQVAAIDDGGTPEDGEDDLYFGSGYTADASGNVDYSINVLADHSYRIEVAPQDDPLAYYLEGNLDGTFAWEQATLIDPAGNPDNIDLQITQGVGLSGTIEGLAEGERIWVNAYCNNGTPENGADDFSFWMELWGDGSQSDAFSLAVPAGYTYQVCFGQDNGIVACYDETDDGTFSGVEPNVVVAGDFVLIPFTVTPAATINGTVHDLSPNQYVQIIAHCDAGTAEDGTDDFSFYGDYNADDEGILAYSLAVPAGYTYTIEFQPDGLSSLYYQSGSINGTDDASLATQIFAETDVHDIDLTLPALGSIAGRVLSDGEPVAGLWIEVWSNVCWDGWLNGAYTNENGYYTVENLPVGDVYVRACANCDEKNFLDQWYTSDGGTEDCTLAEPILANDSAVAGPIDFSLEKGPRYLNWWDVSVLNGNLELGFDIMPGFNAFLTSAEVSGPNSFIYHFDLEADVYSRTNDCQRIDAWLNTIGSVFDEGEYSLTLRFRNGVEKIYTRTLVTASPVAVDSGTVLFSIETDGSIQVAWAQPAAGQLYQVNIYRPDGERVFRSGKTADTSINIPESSLRCMVIGADHQLEVRSFIDGAEDQAAVYSGWQNLTYLPTSGDDFSLSRVRWTSAMDFQGDLSTAFDVRDGSRESLYSASVTLLGDTFSETFDLSGNWYDISTESRLNKGWDMGFEPPFGYGTYQFNVLFSDGHGESRDIELQNAAAIAVEATTMNYEIFENGAMEFYWAIPSGGDSQTYEIRIRSADGSREYFRSNRDTSATSAYASPYDLRALPHGETFMWFVRSYDADGYTMRQSDPLTFVYDPFNMYPRADIDKDWDVDGADLAILVDLIRNGHIDDIPGAMTVFSPCYGRLQ